MVELNFLLPTMTDTHTVMYFHTKLDCLEQSALMHQLEKFLSI